MRPTRFHTIAIPLGLLAAAMGLAGLSGCRGDREDKPPRQFFPDMDDSPKYKPQTANPFFEDGRAMRPAVPGTVAFGRWDFNVDGVPADEAHAWAEPFRAERAALLAEDDALFRGRTADGGYVKDIPVPVTAELLERGMERFNINCASCHGYQGNGLGMVGQRWSYAIPSFHDPKYDKGSADPDGRGNDGFLFHIAMNGVAGVDGYPQKTDDPQTYIRKKAAMKMPGYAEKLTERDGWAIVAYIRALQQHTTLDKIPEPARRRLEQERARLAPVGNGGQP